MWGIKPSLQKNESKYKPTIYHQSFIRMSLFIFKELIGDNAKISYKPQQHHRLNLLNQTLLK